MSVSVLVAQSTSRELRADFPYWSVVKRAIPSFDSKAVKTAVVRRLRLFPLHPIRDGEADDYFVRFEWPLLWGQATQTLLHLFLR